MLKLKFQYFGYLMRRVDSLEKTLMLEGIGGRRKIPHASRPRSQNVERKQSCNKFSKDFEDMVHIEKKKILKNQAPECCPGC